MVALSTHLVAMDACTSCGGSGMVRTLPPAWISDQIHGMEMGNDGRLLMRARHDPRVPKELSDHLATIVSAWMHMRQNEGMTLRRLVAARYARAALEQGQRYGEDDWIIFEPEKFEAETERLATLMRSGCPMQEIQPTNSSAVVASKPVVRRPSPGEGLEID